MAKRRNRRPADAADEEPLEDEGERSRSADGKGRERPSKDDPGAAVEPFDEEEKGPDEDDAVAVKKRPVG